VEEALKVGLVGDYVVRESESTPGAYVLVLKLKPTAFIEQKIKKTPDGKYFIQGQQSATFRTIGQLISSDVRATRPAKGVVLGEKIAGGIARRASMTGVCVRAITRASIDAPLHAPLCMSPRSPLCVAMLIEFVESGLGGSCSACTRGQASVARFPSVPLSLSPPLSL